MAILPAEVLRMVLSELILENDLSVLAKLSRVNHVLYKETMEVLWRNPVPKTSPDRVRVIINLLSDDDFPHIHTVLQSIRFQRTTASPLAFIRELDLTTLIRSIEMLLTSRPIETVLLMSRGHQPPMHTQIIAGIFAGIARMKISLYKLIVREWVFPIDDAPYLQFWQPKNSSLFVNLKNVVVHGSNIKHTFFERLSEHCKELKTLDIQLATWHILSHLKAKSVEKEISALTNLVKGENLEYVKIGLYDGHTEVDFLPVLGGIRKQCTVEFIRF